MKFLIELVRAALPGDIRRLEVGLRLQIGGVLVLAGIVLNITVQK